MFVLGYIYRGGVGVETTIVMLDMVHGRLLFYFFHVKLFNNTKKLCENGLFS